METTITVAALLAGLGLIGASSWLERRLRDIAKPSLLPTTPIMFAGALIALLATIHLFTIFGVHTGR